MNKVTLIEAARSLAASLAIPSRRGTIFAERTEAGERIVIAVDLDWISTARSVPPEHLGYKVALVPKIIGFAGQMWNISA